MYLYDLKTNSLKTPLGIDTPSPSFSWKLSAQEKNVLQQSCHIYVSPNSDMSFPVWDCLLQTGLSAGLLYAGEPLNPSTRYYWQVSITDCQGRSCTSKPSWFETGLMGNTQSVWSSAEWIGAPIPTVNTYHLTNYSLTADVKTDSGDCINVVIGARNRDNYNVFRINLKTQLVTAFEHCDNAWTTGIPTVIALGSADGYSIPQTVFTQKSKNEFLHMELFVKGGCVTLLLNGQPVIQQETDFLPNDQAFLPRKQHMMCFGFKQEDSQILCRSLCVRDLDTDNILLEETFCEEKVIHSFSLFNAVPAVNVRKHFCLTGEVSEIVSARLYSSAMGFYDAYLNGQKINTDFFNPGFTDYRKRIFYQTFDVTSFLQKGENALGAIVSNGYYTGYVGYTGKPMVYGEQNAFLGKLVVTYNDGTKQVIVSDATWQFTDKGPVMCADYLQGEDYDARLEFDWNDLSDSRWKSCGLLPWPHEVTPTNGTLSNVTFELCSQEGPTAQIAKILTPIAAFVENPSGHFVYDLGQNIVGIIRLTLNGIRGKSIKIRYGEMCYQNGTLYVANLRSAAGTDTYTFKGDSKEIFLPSFTSHGFRYVEISGNGCTISTAEWKQMYLSLEGLVITNTLEQTGDFACSNPDINKLQSNIRWGQIDNSLLVFTDCPQRNERMGWTGDAQVFAKTASYNMDVKAFMDKWLLDVADGQLLYNRDGAIPDTAPLGGDNRRMGGCGGWGDAGVIVPWTMYLAYGDIRILERNYDTMKKWVEYQSRNDRQFNGLRTVNGVEVPEQSDLSTETLLQIQQSRGDHLTFDESTPFILSATAYAAHVAELLSKAASVLGFTEDAQKYHKRFLAVRKAFQEAWVAEDGSLSYWGEMSKSNLDTHGNVIQMTRYSNKPDAKGMPSQTAYALAIDFDLIPADKMPRAAECFRQSIEERGGKLSVGFLGISHLAPALTKAGLSEMAFSLLEQTDNPGWLYSVRNGATTIWERWNSYIAETDTFGDVSMNSFNHYAYGAIGEWMFDTILGIQTSEKDGETGYKRIYLQPTFGGKLTWASGYFDSIYGRIESSWCLKNGKFHYRCVIPANTTAQLVLPVRSASQNADSTLPVFELGSGCYSFSCDLQ